MQNTGHHILSTLKKRETPLPDISMHTFIDIIYNIQDNNRNASFITASRLASVAFEIALSTAILAALDV